MYNKILITYDGSEESKKALEHGLSLASLTEAEIILLSVIPRVLTPVFPDEGFGAAPITTSHEVTQYQEKMREIYTESLKEIEDEVSNKYPNLKATTILLEGRPSSTIVEEAEKENVDLIVIGSRGIGGIVGWILGSTSRRVVESCTVPILVIK